MITQKLLLNSYEERVGSTQKIPKMPSVTSNFQIFSITDGFNKLIMSHFTGILDFS